ncbi:MAG: restriction endonuclease subunit S [Gemmatimonadaceae bacterium]
MTTTVSWSTVSLGEVCEFKYGKSLPEHARNPGQYQVYGSNGPVGTHLAALTRKPAIIIGRKGSFGEIHYSDAPCWPIDTTYYVDSTSTDCDLKWLFYRLTSLGLKSLNRAAAVPGLNREDAYRQEFLLPSLDEQRRIAQVLDSVDALRAKRRAAIALLDDLAQSAFLDIFGSYSDGTAESWPIRSVEDVCTLVVDCVNRTAPTVDYETPYKMIRTTNVKLGKIDLSVVRYVNRETFLKWNRRATPRKGDVILTREAPVGEAGILNTNDQVFLGQRLMLYRVDPAKMTAEYLLAAFRSPYLQRQFDKHGSGSTVKHLPLPACRGFRIPAPPLELQVKFERRIRRIHSLKAAHEAHLAELDALFASLQHRAFRGELWDSPAA